MNLEYDALLTRGRALEDAFFFERDRQLIAASERKYTAEETEKLLAAATGIADKLALQEVTSAQAGVQVLAAMALLPLVGVAWCDGDVSVNEKNAILKAADAMGIGVDSHASASEQMARQATVFRRVVEVEGECAGDQCNPESGNSLQAQARRDPPRRRVR